MRSYTIQEGDTLGTIAEQQLGKASRWQELWAVNRRALEQEQVRRLGNDRTFRGARHSIKMQGPDWIFPGTVIALPE